MFVPELLVCFGWELYLEIEEVRTWAKHVFAVIKSDPEPHLASPQLPMLSSRVNNEIPNRSPHDEMVYLMFTNFGRSVEHCRRMLPLAAGAWLVYLVR
jgi:hypothetical protein